MSLRISVEENYQKLKESLKQPKQYIINHFERFLKEIEYAFFKVDSFSNNPRLRKNYNLIRNKVKDFEIECLFELDKNNQEFSNKNIISEVQLKLDENKLTLNEMKDFINDKIYQVEKELFLNRTMFFIEFKMFKLSDLDPVNTEIRNIQYCKNLFGMNSSSKINLMANFSKFPNELKHKSVRLFYIKNHYFDEQSLSILKK